MGERPDEIERVDPLASRLSSETDGNADVFMGEPGAAGETSGYSPDVTWGATDTTDTGAFAGTSGDIAYGDTDNDIETTRAQIEETRADMSETIDAIQQRLNPQNLADQAKETVREATIGKAEAAVNNASDTARGFGSSVLETIRQNPVPAALAGISIGWLVSSGRKAGSAQGIYPTGGYTGPRGTYGAYNTAYTREQYEQGYGTTGQTGASTVGDTVNRVQNTAGNVADQAQGAVGETVSQAQDAAGRIADRVQNTASNVADQVQDTAGQVASQVGNVDLMGTIRANPIPAALVGLGLGWLYMSTRNQSSTQQTYPYRAYSYGQTTSPYRSYDAGYYGTERTGDGSRAATQGLQDAAGAVADRAQDTADRFVEGAQNAAGQVQDQASQVGDVAQHQVQRAAGGFQQMLQERPLAVGAAAAALGLAIGLAVPETPQEHQLMGPARDNLMGQAQQAAQQTAEKVQSVAQEAVGAAREEAQNQNLM